jgi:hypothetical protein
MQALRLIVDQHSSPDDKIALFRTRLPAQVREP